MVHIFDTGLKSELKVTPAEFDFIPIALILTNINTKIIDHLVHVASKQHSAVPGPPV